MHLGKDEFRRATRLLRCFVSRDDEIFWHLNGIWEVHPAIDGGQLLAIEVCSSGKVPGVDRAEFHLLDAQGRTVSRSKFYLGWRHSVRRVERVQVEGIDAPVIRFDMEPMAAHVPLARAYYSMAGTEAAVIRLELEIGDSRPNNYYAVNWTVGPPLPKRAEEAWLAALRSPDPVERLRSLVWLEGAARSPTLKDPINPDPQVWSLAAMAASEAVKDAIRALRTDPVSWVSEASRRLSN